MSREQHVESFSDVSPDTREHLARFAHQLLANEALDVVRIECGGKSWIINKIWVCNASPVLAHRLAEVNTNSRLQFFNDQSSSTVNAMVHFLYHGDYDEDDYDETDFPNAEDSSPLLHNAQVYGIAIQLQITKLAEKSFAKFQHLVQIEVLRPHFAAVVKLIYESPFLGDLKQLVANACAPYARKILSQESWIAESESHALHHLRKFAHDTEAFREDLEERIPPPAPCGHSCRESGCSNRWHYCRCPMCSKEICLRGLVLTTEMIIHCPVCGTAGCKIDKLAGIL
ncbi:hypothetical protein AC578_10547 [Pseudocercospora eumusae]|uniref:BTB domain-containing protein n=1 Tax=Pseudocercospora eumusae TaxID=321146 RepID=A0A139H5U2_9PEZI|nr:hypothetical protein AC578_10547 [Pseudocercospora eumusae]